MSEVERVLVAPGSALVARQGSTVLLVAQTTGEHEALVGRILDWASDGHDGADLVRRVGAMVTGLPPDDVPPLGLVALTGSSSAVVLCAGDVRAVVETGTRTELRGLDATTYVERLVDPNGTIRVTLPPVVDLDGWSPLGADSVQRGGGFLVCLAHDPEPGSGATAEGPWMEAEPTLVGLVMPPLQPDGTLAEAPAEAGAHPGADAGGDPGPGPEAVGATEAGTDVRVWGVRCENGHFTRPAVAACLTCGVELDPAQEPFRDLRPSRGWVVADHGEQRELFSDVIVGREPGIAVDVLAGLADPLPLSDSKLAMSRVHSRIRLEGWDVRVEDLGSANGTFVSLIEGEWEMLPAGETQVLTPGARIAVGSRVLRLDPPR